MIEYSACDKILEELDKNFVAAIESRDIGRAEKLMSVSGLSNPNTWFSLFKLLCNMRPGRNDVSDAIHRLLLSQANKEVLTKIFRAAIDQDCDSVMDVIMRENPTFNINAYDENGDTFLHIAVHKDNQGAVMSLCYKVADVNAKNKKGSTVLHLAVLIDNPVVAFHLMDAGANCDLKDSLGRTALHIATINNNTDVMEQLLSFDADINITCNDNKTPLDYRPNSTILKRNILARKALYCYISDQNLAHIDLDGNDRETFEYYKSEINDLKTETINNSNVSYYAFLTCGMNRLAVYAENEKLIYAVNLRSWNQPWYEGFIYKRVKLGVKRKDLLSSSLKSLDIAICALFDKALPDIDLAYAITDYLSNEDLDNLIKAAPSVEDYNS